MKKLIILMLILSLSIMNGCNEQEQSGYNCNSGNCMAVFENPQYLTLSDCQSDCSVNSNGYNCIDGNCVSVSVNAQYPTISSCQSACGGNNNSSGYNCVSGNCVSVSDNAQFSTISACQSQCSNKGTITFVVYQKCTGSQPSAFGSATLKNGAHVNLAISQYNLNNGIYFYNTTTNNNGKAIISELEPRTYYYNVNGAICTCNCLRSTTGSFTLGAGNNIERRVDLY